MPIAISADHAALAETVGAFLAKHDAVAANRQQLETEVEQLPAFWKEIASIGWLGLHLSVELGGSGFGIPELAVVVEQFGMCIAPGPFVPTVTASAVIAAGGGDDLAKKYLPGLAAGTVIGAVALAADLTLDGERLTGTADAVLEGGLADVILLPLGDDVVIIERSAEGVDVSVPKNLDPSRRSARVSLSSVTGVIIPNGRQILLDLARAVFAAESTGVARACTDRATAYAKIRTQFGRPIGMFQAVKHQCADMYVAAELATSAAWDAARAAETGGEQLSYASAVAAALAVPAAVKNAQLNLQIHGGIGYTWDHDVHIFLRRALAISVIVDAYAAAEDVTALTRQGVTRSRAIEMPPEAEPIRAYVGEFAKRIAGLGHAQQRDAMLQEGYAVPHWPKPWGRDAGAVEQLVIEQEFAAAEIARPEYGITGWVILTLVQHGTDDQISRYVGPALREDQIWCQLFSEPEAGSDAAGIKTRATRVEGGWRVNGQKVWTTYAHRSAFGLATVRTNPAAPKHKGITVMVIDMHAEGVEIRPLREITGETMFNEIFLDDVLVPDDDVVGSVDDGWTVARAALGNESVSVGAGLEENVPLQTVIAALDAHPERLPGGEAQLGSSIAGSQANDLMTLRSAQRAAEGGGPGPEGFITKLAYTELRVARADLFAALTGPDLAYTEGPGALAASTVLGVRALTIAGGTSEIKRNQIGERILGLPREPMSL